VDNRIFEANQDFGRFLPEARLKAVLKGLNPGFHFDVGGNLDFPHPMMEKRQGVWFNGHHICSMDRGNIPEYKIWMLDDGVEDVPWGEIDRHDDVQIAYMEILKTDPGYEQAWLAFEAKRDGYHLDASGKLFHYRACRHTLVPSYIEYVGWRHTLYRILNKGIPNVTKETLCVALGLNVHMAHFNEKVAFMTPTQ
jgi:hypothetical protein